MMNCKVRMSFLWLVSILGLWTLSAAAAVEPLSLSSPQDILDRALVFHPQIVQAQAKANQGKKLTEAASQRPNPELDTRTAFGNAQGAAVVNSDVVLAHIFELGGKRSARIEKATAELSLLDTEVLRAKEEVALSVVTALYRLRQIKAEIETLDEALHTFNQIKKQLSSRPKLTPEQRVAFSIFKLASSDYTLRRTTLEGEESAWVKLIQVAIGMPFQVKKELLPPLKEKWPKLEESNDIRNSTGSRLSRLKVEVKTAEAELSLAESEAWPNLRVGPNFQTQTQAGLSYQAYGVGLSLPLPLYQANGGGKQVAVSGLDSAEISYRTGSDYLQTERNRELSFYLAATQALQLASTLREVEKEHQKVEDLFRVGLIQSSLVIEAHRQIVDLTRSLNEQELAAVRALWKIYALDGRLLQEKL